MDAEPFTLQSELQTPGQITCLAFGHAGHIFAGSADGSLRVYDLSSNMVIKAVTKLGGELSCVICVKRPGSELRDAWVACGRRVMKFQMDSQQMIQTVENALVNIDIGAELDEDDVLNELSLNSNKTHIAFCTDSGTVGVVDLSTKAVHKMKTKHTSISGNVKFIPDRPREIVSGGYDTALLHFDFHERKILSTFKIPPYTVAGGIRLSPPFIMSMAVHSNGMIAAGTADGRLMIGCGGVKPSQRRSRRKTRKWEGLDQEEYITPELAEGPIVALAFESSNRLTMSTMLGLLARYEIIFDEVEGSITVDRVWQQESQYVKKVNALIVDGKRIIVGGLTAAGRGSIEIWKQR